MRLAYFLTRDSDVANDIMQEAFVRVGGRMSLLREPENAKGYLYRTINNLANGHGRGLTRRRKLEQRLPPAGQESEPDLGERQEMWERLLKLPIRQRTALFLRYYADLSESEAAGIMDCSTAAVKSLTHRAIDALRSEQGGFS
jgi:RNA polymerase sigma factor (sigma-70 family)